MEMEVNSDGVEEVEFPFAATTTTSSLEEESSHSSPPSSPLRVYHDSGDLVNGTSPVSAPSSPTLSSSQSPPLQSSLPSPHTYSTVPTTTSSSSVCYASTNNVPMLTASVTSTSSSNMDGSVSASALFNSACTAGESSLLDAAASLLLPNLSTDEPSFVSSTSSSTGVGMRSLFSRTHDESTTEFSQLLDQATPPASMVPLLPSVPEETIVEDNSQRALSNSGSFISARAWGSSQQAASTSRESYVPPLLLTKNSATTNRLPQPDNSHLGQTIVPSAAATTTAIRSQQPLSALAGVTARQTGPNRFRVELEMPVQDAGASVDRVMTLWRNASALNQWCQLMPSDATILTTYTQGTAMGEVESDRRLPYEGEWTHATTAASLCLPKSSCWHTCKQAWLRTWGLAEYATIRVFAEPARQRVNLSLSPLPGCGSLDQQLSVETLSPHKIRLVNEVQLDGVMSVSLWSSFWYPSVHDYMQQTIDSMVRLRFCVE